MMTQNGSQVYNSPKNREGSWSFPLPSQALNCSARVAALPVMCHTANGFVLPAQKLMLEYAEVLSSRSDAPRRSLQRRKSIVDVDLRGLHRVCRFFRVRLNLRYSRLERIRNLFVICKRIPSRLYERGQVCILDSDLRHLRRLVYADQPCDCRTDRAEKFLPQLHDYHPAFLKAARAVRFARKRFVALLCAACGLR